MDLEKYTDKVILDGAGKEFPLTDICKLIKTQEWKFKSMFEFDEMLTQVVVLLASRPVTCALSTAVKTILEQVKNKEFKKRNCVKRIKDFVYINKANEATGLEMDIPVDPVYPKDHEHLLSFFRCPLLTQYEISLLTQYWGKERTKTQIVDDLNLDVTRQTVTNHLREAFDKYSVWYRDGQVGALESPKFVFEVLPTSRTTTVYHTPRRICVKGGYQKYCYACRTTKDENDFRNSSSKKDGKRDECRPCHQAQKYLRRKQGLEKKWRRPVKKSIS